MKIVLGISGATGAIYGIRILEALKERGVETHLIMSEWAEKTITIETPYKPADIKDLATYAYSSRNQAAIISSGSFLTDGMIIAPCSMKSLASISYGLADNLLSRTADVTLKEKRKLVIVPREAPLSEIHLENMLRLARAGAVILPPMPAFYNKPTTVDQIVNHTVARVLDQFRIENKLTERWLQSEKTPTNKIYEV
ncbi:UbiX family flavin prenyltransferase [Mesobacillus harenae]|uniref:UbiX family flavin prenyltransferase n=1 Tax=Mesobacillus harenae TaxID=2213203 RepID=UPI0015805A47|nr:UbiX family flavin prenyltransferase [Mesobacillus harenae]